MTQTTAFYRRRLPHWRQENATYFVTWRIAANQEKLSAPERGLVAAEIRSRQGQYYELHAYVIMDDHAHVLVEPTGGHALEKIVHSWKSFTAHNLQRQAGRSRRIWQDEYFDRIVRDEKEFAEKFDYILSNPWKRWPELVEYAWVWPAR